MRFAVCAVALLASGCGKILDETDAGDAATNDAGGEVGDAGGPKFFACGEPGNYIYCEPTSQYCLLVRSSHARDYSCQLWDGGDSPTCAGQPPASARYECGCYTGPSGEITITVCQ